MTEYEYRCRGRKRDGRPCRTLFFKGWVEDGFISIICHKCNTRNIWGVALGGNIWSKQGLIIVGGGLDEAVPAAVS